MRNIQNEDKVIMKQTRKSILYNNNEPWVNKDSRYLM